MRILQINSLCDMGSTGRIAADMCREHINNGDEAVLAYGRGGKTNAEFPSVRIGTDIDFFGHIFMTRLFDLSGFGSVGATKKFLEWVDAYNPDLIHLHNIHGYYINIELLFDYIKKKNKKTHWTLHDCWPMTGHCVWAGDEADCDRWISGCNNCPVKKDYPSSYFRDNSSNNYARKQRAFTGVKDMTIITPSEWLKTKVEQSFLREYDVNVKRNKIDLSAFVRRESSFRDDYNIGDKRIYLCVAFNWVDRKLNDLLRINEKLGDNEIMVLVGINNEVKKRLPDNVVGIYRTDSKEELAEIYSAADVFINPTYQDNYPTVNLEAQACGTYVITYRSGGSPETLKEGMGVAVDPGDVDGIISTARKLWKK